MFRQVSNSTRTPSTIRDVGQEREAAGTAANLKPHAVRTTSSAGPQARTTAKATTAKAAAQHAQNGAACDAGPAADKAAPTAASVTSSHVTCFYRASRF